MNPLAVFSVYGAALALAVVLLFFFHARWFWHVLSVAAALGIGLTPLPPEWKVPDLVVGFVFFFLLAWGVGAPAFRPVYRRRSLKNV